MVKRFFNLKTCLKKRRSEFRKSKIVLIRVHLETGCKLAYSGAKVPSCFYPVDLVTRMGDWEIRSVSGRLLDYPGELACMPYVNRQYM